MSNIEPTTQDHSDADFAARWREYLERYWHLECQGCGAKEFTTQATAELVGWCLQGKTVLCHKCCKVTMQELQTAFIN